MSTSYDLRKRQLRNRYAKPALVPSPVSSDNESRPQRKKSRIILDDEPVNKDAPSEHSEQPEDPQQPPHSPLIMNVRSKSRNRRRNPVEAETHVMSENLEDTEYVDNAEGAEEAAGEMADFIVNGEVEEGAEGDEEDDDYWDHDRAPLINVITKRLGKILGDSIPAEDLKTAVTKSIDKASENLIDEYCGVKPNDKRWQAELDPEKVEKLKPELEKIRQQLEDETPSMPKILEAKIPFNDKKRAVELFDILQNAEPYTEEYVTIRNKINTIIRRTIIYTDEELTAIEEQEKKFLEKVDNPNADMIALKKKIFELDADDNIKTRIYEKVLKLQRLSPDDSEYRDTREWIMIAVDLPYRKVTPLEVVGKSNEEINDYCTKIMNKLNAELYGMEGAKEALITMLNDRITNPSAKGCSLALVGPPGVGKTYLAKVFADAVGLPFEMVPLGGMEDPGIIKGSHGRFVGSTPSIVLQILKRMKTASGIVLWDEIDKLGSTPFGLQVQHALLHLSDYTTNQEFRDNFLSDFPHDISPMWFFYSMNNKELLDEALCDRMPVITVEPYSSRDKRIIIDKYVLPRELKAKGLPSNEITFTEEGLNTLMSLMTEQIKSKGIRPVEKEIRGIVSRINFLKTNILEDGTYGQLKLSFAIPNFKIPVALTTSQLMKLCSKETTDKSGYLSMYA